MRISVAVLAAIVAIGSTACGATRVTGGQADGLATPLVTVSATFMTRDEGKDTDSTVVVQLLRNNAELAAEARIVGTGFDDDTTSAPIVFGMSGPFRLNDVSDGEVRIRLTPDGSDDWTFDMRLTLGFADGTNRSFFWPGLRLDNQNPERTLSLAPAQLP